MLNKTHRDTESFLRQIQNVLPVFDSNTLPQEPLPKKRWAQLMDEGICLPAIPVAHEGRHNHREMCEVIEMMSEYNLPLGMYTMIVTVLFLRNVALSGSSRLQAEVFEDFLENPVIGGIAFTEPEHGSSLSRMKTTYEEQDGSYYVRGSKHWQAFSAQADWWIVCARQYAGKQFGYFVHRRSDGGFVTTEVYDSLGLKNLGYGLNEIDIRVAPHRRLDKRRSGLGDTAEILCASRFSKAAMSSGFLRRLYREALSQTQSRQIGKGSLYDIEYVRYKVSRIRNHYVICNALYHHLLLEEDYTCDISGSMFASLATKVLSSELMLDSAIDYQQLCGGEGYRTGADNIAAHALLDARVYTIFDGTNDLLCQHLADIALHEMHVGGFANLRDVLQANPYSRFAAAQAPQFDDIDTQNLNQAGRVVLGRMLSRVFGLDCLVRRAQRLHQLPGAGLVARDHESQARYDRRDIRQASKLLMLNLNALREELDYVQSDACA